MQAKKMDVDQLEIIGRSSKHSHPEISKVMDLFKSRKIESFDTARNIVNGFSSRGPSKQQEAKS